jgi:hypothetical protein
MMKTEERTVKIVTAQELRDMIMDHLATIPENRKWKSCKNLLKWRLYCPQLNLWAGLDGLDIVPLQTPEKAQVFDARDNAEMKQRFYTATTGIKWSIELL